jgi:ABC-type branched-subunit amino acid transport system substrate-binding protein
MRSNRLLRLLAVVFAMALVATACGGDDDDEAEDEGGGAQTIARAPGFDGRTIKLGDVTPLTGPVAVIGKPLTAGHEVYWQYVNDQLGGVGGKYKVELVTEDSQYNPQVAVQAYNKLKGDVVLFDQLLGTPSTNAVLPLLKTDKIAAAPASLDAEWVGEANLIPIGGPYQIQMINGADWVNSADGGNLKGKAACSMIQDDPYGQAGQEGIDFAAEELDFELATTAKYKTGDQDFTGQITQLKNAGCQVVYFVGVVSDVGKIFGTAAQLQFAPKWIAQSPSWIGALAASPLKDYFAANFILVGEGTEWGDPSVKGMTDMIARIQKYKPDQQPDYYFSFGYIQARAVHQILEKAVEEGDLSREGILDAIENVGTLTFDGLSGDYKYGTPEEREFPRSSTIFKINTTKPIGLEKVEGEYESRAAKQFELET